MIQKVEQSDQLVVLLKPMTILSPVLGKAWVPHSVRKCTLSLISDLENTHVTTGLNGD